MAYHLTTAYLIVFDLVLLGVLTEVLRRAGASGRLRLAVVLGSVAWITLLVVLLEHESLLPQNVSPVVFMLAVLGVVGSATAIGFLTPIRRLLMSAPHEMLLLPQGVRMFFGAGFLIQGVLGLLPRGFTIVDGITHISAAFLCLVAAVLIQGRRERTGGLWLAHVFGLADIFVVAIGMSFYLLHHVGPHHNIMLAALFAAPLFLNLHAVSLAKLVVEGRDRAPSEAAESGAGLAAGAA